jgi:hypothetical protein
MSLLIIVILSLFFIGFQLYSQDQLENNYQVSNEVKKTKLDINSLFNIYGFDENFQIENEKKVWDNVKFELNPEHGKFYDELSRIADENTVVISPTFTAVAYHEPGFYTYYRGECGEKCLTVELQKDYSFDYISSGNGLQVLKLLGYEIISDIDIDQNPNVLEKYDKVILLHNEYVTKKEFNAIVNHPNVIYLYPNSLYGEIIVDYENNSMTLLRGHNFPTSEITNGFDWKFDNSPSEYNENCKDMGFDKIDNGWMLNCYPERAIHQSKVLLKMIKEF